MAWARTKVPDTFFLDTFFLTRVGSLTNIRVPAFLGVHAEEVLK
jgi:hypothetical protein